MVEAKLIHDLMGRVFLGQTLDAMQDSRVLGIRVNRWHQQIPKCQRLSFFLSHLMVQDSVSQHFMKEARPTAAHLSVTMASKVSVGISSQVSWKKVRTWRKICEGLWARPKGAQITSANISWK